MSGLSPLSKSTRYSTLLCCFDMPPVLFHSTSALVLATLLLVGVGVNMVRAGLAALTLLNGGVAMIKTGIATLL